MKSVIKRGEKQRSYDKGRSLHQVISFNILKEHLGISQYKARNCHIKEINRNFLNAAITFKKLNVSSKEMIISEQFRFKKREYYVVFKTIDFQVCSINNR